MTRALLVLALVVSAACAPSAREVEITISHSRFDPSFVLVPVGVPVVFVLRNDDPIDHEWIVGTAALHQRHRAGSEPYHDSRATEVTVPALSQRRTTVVFEERGDYPVICHLPGHERYGMVGLVRVR